jgi:hypothetical protein
MIISVHRGENSYRNLDFTPATEIAIRQRDFKIKESQVQSITVKDSKRILDATINSQR